MEGFCIEQLDIFNLCAKKLIKNNLMNSITINIIPDSLLLKLLILFLMTMMTTTSRKLFSSFHTRKLFSTTNSFIPIKSANIIQSVYDSITYFDNILSNDELNNSLNDPENCQ